MWKFLRSYGHMTGIGFITQDPVEQLAGVNRVKIRTFLLRLFSYHFRKLISSTLECHKSNKNGENNKKAAKMTDLCVYDIE